MSGQGTLINKEKISSEGHPLEKWTDQIYFTSWSAGDLGITKFTYKLCMIYKKKMYNNILLYTNIGLAILSDFYNKFIILGPLQREEIFSTPLLTALSWWLVFRSCRILPQS